MKTSALALGVISVFLLLDAVLFWFANYEVVAILLALASLLVAPKDSVYHTWLARVLLVWAVVQTVSPFF